MIGWLLGSLVDTHWYFGIAIGAIVGGGAIKLCLEKAVTAIEGAAKKS